MKGGRRVICLAWLSSFLLVSGSSDAPLVCLTSWNLSELFVFVVGMHEGMVEAGGTDESPTKW